VHAENPTATDDGSSTTLKPTELSTADLSVNTDRGAENNPTGGTVEAKDATIVGKEDPKEAPVGSPKVSTSTKGITEEPMEVDFVELNMRSQEANQACGPPPGTDTTVYVPKQYQPVTSFIKVIPGNPSNHRLLMAQLRYVKEQLFSMVPRSSKRTSSRRRSSPFRRSLKLICQRLRCISTTTI